MAAVILYTAWLILLASVAAVYRALMLFERRPLQLTPGGEEEAQHGWWRRVNTAGGCALVAGGLLAASAVGFVLHFAVEGVTVYRVVNGTG